MSTEKPDDDATVATPVDVARVLPKTMAALARLERTVEALAAANGTGTAKPGSAPTTQKE